MSTRLSVIRTCKPIGSTQGWGTHMRHWFSAASTLVLLAGLSSLAYAEGPGAAKHQAAVASQQSPAKVDPADFVGADTCATCHADESKKFSSNPHARLALEHGGKGVTCESCHGPGKAHVESGGVASDIFQFSKATPKQVEKKCLSCHIGAHPNFERTAHGQALISCTNCHSSHKFVPETKMLKAKEPTLCYQCHTDAKAAFM